MIIDNQKHYVSIPKTEFEKMEAIVNDKKDINVTFRLSLYTNNYGNYEQIFYCHNLTYELNERIDWEKINDTSKLIQSACEKVLEEKNKDISVLNYELSEIKSKWWYKLFSW